MFTLFRRRLTSLLVLTHIQPSCSLRTFCLRRWDVSTTRPIFSRRPRSTTNEQRDSSSKSFVSVHQLNNRLCKRFAELSQLAGNIECIDQLMDLLRTQNSMEEILNLINQVTSPLVHTRIAELLHTLLNVSFNFQRNKRFNQTEISLKQTNQQIFSYWLVEHRSTETTSRRLEIQTKFLTNIPNDRRHLSTFTQKQRATQKRNSSLLSFRCFSSMCIIDPLLTDHR